MYKHILIATDGSELAQKAVDHGLGLAKALGARVTATTVSEPWLAIAPADVGVAFPIEEYRKGCADNAARILSAVDAAAARDAVQHDAIHLEEKFPAEAILALAAERNCDLIVMASHGRRGFSRLFLGSETNRVICESKIPVLVCR